MGLGESNLDIRYLTEEMHHARARARPQKFPCLVLSILGFTRKCTIPEIAPLLNPVDPGGFFGVPTLTRNPYEEFEQDS